MLARLRHLVRLLVEEGVGLSARVVALLLLRGQLALLLGAVLGVFFGFPVAHLLALAHVLAAVAVVEMASGRSLFVVVEFFQLLGLRVAGGLLLGLLVLGTVACAFQRRNRSALVLKPLGELPLVLVLVVVVSLLPASALDFRVTGRIIVVIAAEVCAIGKRSTVREVDTSLIVLGELRAPWSAWSALNTSVCLWPNWDTISTARTCRRRSWW